MDFDGFWLGGEKANIKMNGIWGLSRNFIKLVSEFMDIRWYEQRNYIHMLEKCVGS